jgi:hypothetical protein
VPSPRTGRRGSAGQGIIRVTSADDLISIGAARPASPSPSNRTNNPSLLKVAAPAMPSPLKQPSGQSSSAVGAEAQPGASGETYTRQVLR